MNEDVRIFSLGESALTVEFGTTISEKLNKQAIALADHFVEHPFPGFIESVPAYASATIFYDPIVVRQEFEHFNTAFAAVSHVVNLALVKVGDSDISKSRLIEIPVRFANGGEFDLDHVADHNHISATEVIAVFTSTTYRVYMLGFLPGFSYMGEVDQRIATPRKETPRTNVPAGSVGIAGRQTGIYSLDSPGGWQIIGRTDVEMFSPNAESPCYLQPGDSIKFVSV